MNLRIFITVVNAISLAVSNICIVLGMYHTQIIYESSYLMWCLIFVMRRSV